MRSLAHTHHAGNNFLVPAFYRFYPEHGGSRLIIKAVYNHYMHRLYRRGQEDQGAIYASRYSVCLVRLLMSANNAAATPHRL